MNGAPGALFLGGWAGSRGKNYGGGGGFVAVMPGDRIGEVTHYFQEIDVAIISLEAPLEVGDKVHVEGATDDFTFTIESMEIDHESVQRAEPGQDVGVKVPERAHEGSLVSEP